MKSFKQWFSKPQNVVIVFILLLAFLLRFYSYENRWGLAYDQAHDALVARYALQEHKIPLLGPFSSAGPFQTGGEWYWFIMAGTAIYPGAVITPWVVLTFLNVIFFFLMIRLGKELIDLKFGLILGLLSAVSTSQIAQSTNLTNQSPLSIISLFAIWSSVLYLKKRSLKYLFFLGFFTSLAMTIHLQGVSLLLFAFATLIFAGFPTLKGLFLLFLGFFLPVVPILIFDIQSDFVNVKGMIQYYFFDQYKIPFEVLGRRWLTYLTVFWPSAWSHVIGANIMIGYLLIFGVSAVSIFGFLRKTIGRDWYVIITGFISMVFLLRYVRTILFESYIMFLNPFILILTGWFIYTLLRKNILVGLGILLIVLSGSIHKDIIEIKNAENYAAKEAEIRIKKLFEEFPNQKFAVYDYHYKWADKNLILSLFLDVSGAIDDKGRRVGVVVATRSGEFKYPIILGDKIGYQLLDLNSSKRAHLVEDDWVLVNPSAIYQATEEWYKK